MSTRIGEFIGDHKATVFVVSAALAISLHADTDPGTTRYYSLHDPRTVNGLEWPVALDPMACLEDKDYNPLPCVFGDQEATTILARTESIGQYIPGLNRFTNANEDSPKPSATRAQINAAALLIKKTPYICPDTNGRGQFKGAEKDPHATICLKTEDLSVITGNIGTTVVMKMIINPDYEGTMLPSLSKTFANYTPNKCKAITIPQRAFGRSIFESTPDIPVGKTVPVELVVDGDASNICNTWPPAGTVKAPRTNKRMQP